MSVDPCRASLTMKQFHRKLDLSCRTEAFDKAQEYDNGSTHQVVPPRVQAAVGRMADARFGRLNLEICAAHPGRIEPLRSDRAHRSGGRDPCWQAFRARIRPLSRPSHRD